MRATIAQEAVDQCWPDMATLVEDHWREVALYRDAVPLDPDVERYRGLERAGRLVILTAREAGALVGYSVFLVHNHLHYRQCKVASNDLLFLRQDRRAGSGLGIRLIRESEKALAALGVDRITWHVKAGNDWSDILARMGYDMEEKIMGRLLKEGASHGV